MIDLNYSLIKLTAERFRCKEYAMDVLFTNNRIDQLIAEDVPYIDLTTEILGI